MKSPSLPSILLASLIPLGSVPAATSFIRQTQSVGGVNVASDIPVTSNTGQVMSGALTSEMSVFQLYTIYTNPQNQSILAKLDEKSVGTFLPRVTIQTFSEDPHVPTSTRADRPYGVSVTVSGMLTGGTVPDYAKMVRVGRGYTLYSPASFTPASNDTEYADAWVYRANGTFVDSPVYQRLPVGSPTLATGIERYFAYVLPETTGDPGQLASAEIRIWPAAIANINGINGIETGKVHYRLPDEGSIQLTYAYPRSTTYAQIYKGRERLGASGTTIPPTIKQFNTETPQNAVLTIGSLADYIDEDGEYTIEVLTITPFNGGAPERLAYVTFQVNRTIEVEAMIETLE